MTNVRTWLTYYIPVFVWMTTIFLLSSRQRISVNEDYWLNFSFFKTLHLIEYAVLYLLVFRAIAKGAKPTRAMLTTALAITVLYAVSDEIHQTFVPTREGTLRDVLIDTAGASIMMTAISRKLIPFQKQIL